MKTIQLYCDGGCRGNQSKDNIGAWGVLLVYGEHRKELSGGDKNTTNNKMELTSCIMGLSELKRKDVPVVVYVDSQYVCDGITKWIKGWKKKGWKSSSGDDVKNKELWVELDSLVGSFANISFKKVVGHSDTKFSRDLSEHELGNIRADKLCNEYMDRFMQNTLG